MLSRLSWFGAVVVVILVGFVAAVGTNAAVQAWSGGESSIVARADETVEMSPPPCNELCDWQTACDEPCGYGGTTTCGDYGVCQSCSHHCEPTTSCDFECWQGEALTTCGAVPYTCGQPPPSNCPQVCEHEWVFCSTQCWNGSTTSTCGAEQYDCDQPCYQPGMDNSGLFADRLYWDNGLNDYIVDCYVREAYFSWDPCQSSPILDLDCDDVRLEQSIPESECFATYWYYGTVNTYGC